MTRRVIPLVAAVVLILAVSVWFWQAYRAALSTAIVPKGPVLVDIPKGASLAKIITSLHNEKLSIEPFWFKVIAYRYRLAGKLKAGEYELPTGITALEALKLFAQGKVKQYAVTFPEGWTFKEMLKLLAETPKLEHVLVSQDMFQVLKQLGVNKSHAEGWFFPDTYRFTKGTSDISILKKAHAKMQMVLDREWQQKESGLPLKNAYQALTLASIIEKETGNPSERPEIAGVFTRRLQKGMLLQTDPTVIYGMGDVYDGNIRSKDLKTPTPYNTYVISGLPPTPIAMPGLDAIHAALHPFSGKSLYFVANGNGKHLFSESLAQHNEAVNKYQKKRKSHAPEQR